MCEIVFSDSKTAQDCLAYNNGVLKKGLTNTMLSLYYYIIQEYVAFNSFDGKPWKRDDTFLTQHEFSL